MEYPTHLNPDSCSSYCYYS